MSDNDSEMERELGRHLDEYLRDQRDGESSGSEPQHDAVTDLRRVVDRLNELSKLASQDDLDQELPPRIGKYEILHCIGRSGQSYTFLSFDPDLLRDVVLKFYHQTAGKPARESILREARTLTRVDSPYVVDCYTVDRIEGVPYLVLEFVPGTTLADLIKTQHWDYRSCAELICHVAQGLADVHAMGLLHRDLKPGNIMVSPAGLPKLIDFGLVANCGSTSSGGGTPQYMAPEQARGQWDQIDQRTDLFGVGAVLYELLSGKKIYGDGSKEEILQRAQQGEIRPLDDLATDAPQELREICMHCLAADPSQRPASAQVLADQLGRFAQSNPRLRILWYAAMAVAVGALLLAAGWTQWFRATSEETPPVAAQPDDVPEVVGKWAKIYQTFAQQPVPSNEQLGLRNDFSIQFDLVDTSIQATERIVVPEDEVLRFSVRPERSCYVAIYSVEFADNESLAAIVRLFPQYSDEDNFVREGETLIVPPVAARRAKGFELLYIVASTNPMRLESNTNHQGLATFESEDRRQAWDSRLRGFRRTGELTEKMIPYQITPRDDQ
ncbi:MAG: serine/threonine-protein kinase [Pirellulales bacterium]|nr:serine/threonine-protein kinase [Pirellulales bacterium]